MDFLPILIAIIVVVGFIALLMIFSGSKGKSGRGGKQKSRQVIIKDSSSKFVFSRTTLGKGISSL